MIIIDKESKYSNSVPVWEKLNLTVEEAVDYSNIGENRLREILNKPDCTFALCVGNKKKLIKRKQFEKYLENATWI